MFFNLLSSWRHHPHIWLSSHVRIFRPGQEPWPISQSPDLKTGSLCNHLHIDRQTRHVTINPLPQDYNKLKWMDRPFHRLTRLHSTKKKAALDRRVCVCVRLFACVCVLSAHICVYSCLRTYCMCKRPSSALGHLHKTVRAKLVMKWWKGQKAR